MSHIVDLRAGQEQSKTIFTKPTLNSTQNTYINDVSYFKNKFMLKANFSKKPAKKIFSPMAGKLI